MKRASIDIGSNSILLLVGEVKEGSLKVLENHSHVTGLGRDLDLNKEFIEIAMEESLEVLKSYADIAKKYGIDPSDILTTATEASRVAKNAELFFNHVKDETGIRVNIISGEGEAYYSTTGILADDKITDENIVIMDIGGASTEIIHVDCAAKEIVNSFSMPVGAVRMNNWIANNTQEENLRRINTEFKKQLNSILTKKLYCVAGTMTSVANMHLKNREFKEVEVNGCEFTAQNVREMYDEYKNLKEKDFLNLFPFLGKRSRTIHSGIKLAITVFDWLSIEDVYVSTYGLRYGTLLNGFLEEKYVSKRI